MASVLVDLLASVSAQMALKLAPLHAAIVRCSASRSRRSPAFASDARPLQLERPAATHRFHKARSGGGDGEPAWQSSAGAQQR